MRGLKPLAFALASFAVSLSVWLLLIEPRLPMPLRRRSHPTGTLGWFVNGQVPFYLKGEARADGWLAVGDSRIHHGLDEERLEELGVEPLAVLWIGGAQLDDLLEAARELPQRRLLVALSPLAVHRVGADAGAERELAMRIAVRRWMRRFDRRMDEHLDRLRSSLVHWIDTRDLARAWLEFPRPGEAVPRQARALAPDTRPDRAAALEAIGESLRELRDSGREIVCVRLPTSPAMRAVEDEAFDPASFDRLCSGLDIPYLDLGTSEPTSDGSYLTAEGARHLAPRLAEFVK